LSSKWRRVDEDWGKRLLLQATEFRSPQQLGNYFARLTALLFMGLTAFMGFATALLGPSYIALVLGDRNDGS